MSFIRFFIESSVELSLSALICIYMMTKTNFEKPVEAVTTSLAFVFIAILLAIPIYLTVAKYRYSRETAEGEKESWYKDLYTDLNPHNSKGLFYSPLFLVRRYLAVLGIIMFPKDPLKQVFGHIILSLG